ncbi:methyl-accepting chemotaxis sensory transducer [Methylobacterium sp. 4-46]|uniref:globin-coupled sensor protein n=1 Tax=unclassified Methylobacterium TaxID=2615210 RepID=UPI000152CC97|nr:MULTISPECIES: globin-coupled sensor protein [Methylobacterium]ACA20393.1 methyl-accepting chemotaxis sensory transducer [Methylobacterium sp. 4-46]WFT79562.1 globin-coupled sensor protein [Methylobacterium nodulans]
MLMRRAETPCEAELADQLNSFPPEQQAVLPELRRLVESGIDEVLGTFYSAVARDPALSRILGQSSGVDRLKAAQKAHWLHLLSGRIDADLRARGARIGAAHVRRGLEPRHSIAAYAFLAERFLERVIGRRDRRTRRAQALVRAVFIDMEIALSAHQSGTEAEFREREAAALAGSVETEMRLANRAISSESERLSETVAQMRRAIEAVEGGNAVVDRNAVATSQGIQQVASASEEMVASSREVGRQAGDTSALVREAVRKAEDASRIISRLKDSSGRIAEVVQLIDGVAHQTNLLALNATIEAARAGEAGRGFAVVAAEVKELSRRTAEATKEIARQVEDVVGATSAAVEAVAAVTGSVTAIDQVASCVAANAEGQIRALQEMTGSAQTVAGSGAELTESVQTIATGVEAALGVAGRVDEAAARIIALFDQLERRLVVTVRAFSATDNRRAPRVPARWPASFEAPEGRASLRTIEVSEGGFLIDAPPFATEAGREGTLDLAGIGRFAVEVAGEQPLGTRLKIRPSEPEAMDRLRERIAAILVSQQSLKAALRGAADGIQACFAESLAGGAVTLAQLFDEDYALIPGSAPKQFRTRALAFLDRVLPPFQEPLLAADPSVVFCAAVDRNGWLPVHNRTYSLPQGPDPVWNEANCRNRRLFDDRTGLSAARNLRDFLAQTYPRALGGGRTVLMMDLSTPLTVANRHWGALRMGLTLE